LPTDRYKLLEEELYWARRNFVELVPDDLSKSLSDYLSCSSREDYAKWERDTVEFIISRAEVDPLHSDFEPRGWCPLCKKGVHKIPGGIRNHLNGDGNASQCVVTEAAFRNAKYVLREKFETSEAVVLREVAERRKTEQTFLTDPSLPPKLLDEHQWWSRPRSAEALVAAEERLRNLNFDKVINDNVVAYKLRCEGYLILADPCIAGRITFRVFSDDTSKKGRQEEGSFNLPDGWKKNLAGKFRSLLEETCSRLSARREVREFQNKAKERRG
jgi:hypothetical protein